VHCTLIPRSDRLAAGEKRRIRRDLLRRTDTEALARLHRALERMAGE